jgi:predicted Fe-Mo cluster-binding NifX family protein
MKIAIVSDDGRTISQHFGRAREYIVVECEQAKIVARKSLPRQGLCDSPQRHHGRHDHSHEPRGSGFGRNAEHKHGQMFENIRDCDILLSRGMGRGAYQGLQSLGIRPIVTDIADIEAAIQAVMNNTIVDHIDQLH